MYQVSLNLVEYHHRWLYVLYIALDKGLFTTKKYLYFSYFSTKTYVVGTH